MQIWSSFGSDTLQALIICTALEIHIKDMASNSSPEKTKGKEKAYKDDEYVYRGM